MIHSKAVTPRPRPTSAVGRHPQTHPPRPGSVKRRPWFFRKGVQPWLLLLLAVLWPAASLAAPAIGAVQVTPAVITAGQQTVFSFLLEQPATLRAVVAGPDGRAIAALADGQAKPAGLVTLTWNGRDDTGAVVPDEAYTLIVSAIGENGATTTLDPLASSGGERLDLQFSRMRTMTGKEIISYRLEVPARVTVRAGIRGGAMLRTLIDNVPQPAGDQQVEWDGRDDTGRFDVTAMADNTLTVSGTTLPAATVLVTGNGGDYLTYRRGGAAARPAASASPSPQSLPAPRFSLYAGGSPARSARSPAGTAMRSPLGAQGVETVKGILDITLEIDPSYTEIFNNARFETVVFVDGERFDEEENSYSPYTYHLDSTRIANGRHLITINQVGLTGQIGSYSFAVEINN